MENAASPPPLQSSPVAVMEPEEEETLDNALDMEKCDFVRANPPAPPPSKVVVVVVAVVVFVKQGRSEGERSARAHRERVSVARRTPCCAVVVVESAVGFNAPVLPPMLKGSSAFSETILIGDVCYVMCGASRYSSLSSSSERLVCGATRNSLTV